MTRKRCTACARGHSLRLALLAAVVLAGCAGLPGLPLGTPPHIDVVGVNLDRVAGADAFFTVAVSISNPDDRDVVIDTLGGTLSIERQEVAKGELTTPVRVPAHATAGAEFSAHARMDAVLLAVAKAMQRGAQTAPSAGLPTLHYAIHGRASFAGGVSLPFSKSGDVGPSR